MDVKRRLKLLMLSRSHLGSKHACVTQNKVSVSYLAKLMLTQLIESCEDAQEMSFEVNALFYSTDYSKNTIFLTRPDSLKELNIFFDCLLAEEGFYDFPDNPRSITLLLYKYKYNIRLEKRRVF